MKVNRARLLELFWEYAAKLEELHTFYLDSLAGYFVLYERLSSHQDNIRLIFKNHADASAEFLETWPIDYEDVCKKKFIPVSMSPVMKLGDMKNRVKDNGQNTFLLGDQCIVLAYSYWEEYLRFEIGKAIGVLPMDAIRDTDETKKILRQQVTNVFWAEMGYIRNSIIHNNGIAKSDIEKCKIIRWFKPGDRIQLDYQKTKQIFIWMACNRNELHSMSLPPRKGIRVPISKNK